jgi:hypothetical protein
MKEAPLQKLRRALNSKPEDYLGNKHDFKSKALESKRSREIRLNNAKSKRHGDSIMKDKNIKGEWYKDGPNDSAGFHNKPSNHES